MSFGFGIGDILAVIELAKKIRKDFADAPSQFKDISLEVRSLSIVLQDIEDELSLPDLNAKQKSELKEIIVGCRDVLEKLQQALSTYGEFKSDSRGVGCKAKRIWKRFQWEPDDIKEFRSRVTTNVTFLNAFRGKCTNEILHEIKNSADQFHERQNDRQFNEKSLAILNWLTPINHASQQHDYITQRQIDTGKWLLDSPVFIEWVNSDKQKLFCPGIPGAGKTILTSIVVEELNTRFQNDKGIGIAYFYCNFRRQHDQKIDDLLLSLLKQLSRYQASLPGAVKDMFDLHSPRQNRPSTKEISSALKSVIDSYSKVFIVVDALDECQMTNGCRMQFLSEIFDIQETYQLSLFATSRHIPDVEERFGGSLRLEIRASDKDVERYLDGRISQLPEYVRKSTGLQNEVKTAIVKAVDGMFLLARLNFDSLRGKKSPKVMRNALNSLPTGSDAYRDAYKDAMKRIEGQLDDERDLAKQVLSWITCAKRPLTTAELQEAIAVEIDETELDQENFTEINTMISVCAGLVTVDEESKIIRLVHYTTQEYFEQTRDKWFPDAETFITTICVTYLSFETFNTGFCLLYRDFAKRVRSHQFSMYAARFWGHHAGKASILEKTLEQALLKFLKNQAKVDASWQLINSNDVPESYVDQGSSPRYSGSSYGQRAGRGLTGMHITAFFGLETVIQLLLDSGKLEVDPRDLLSEESDFIPYPNLVNHGRTPLSYAAKKGHEKVVNLLLDTGKFEVDSIDKFHQTPLHSSVESGNENVVKLLLDTGKVDVNFKDGQGQTPFYKAATSGNENVVKLFLETGKVEIDTIDNFDETPLLGAIQNGHESIVKLLLNTGAVDINQSNYVHRTPISFAAEGGFESIVKLLLDTNSVNVNIIDSYHGTPISYATKRGFESIVKLLLDTNSVNVNIIDSYHGTPISYATKRGSESIVKLLLDTNSADVNIANRNRRTPISYALEQGYESIRMLLLSTGKVDISYLDPSGMNIFWWVACWGREPIVKQLLDTGFNLPITQPGPVEGVWWEDEGKVKLLIKRYTDMKIDIHPATEENIRKLWPGVLEDSRGDWNEQLESVICEGMAFKRIMSM
ncbi:uncharacterized protein EAF02_007180 [Botrytis sinoallii]|uniref:uncharacterized protein n=1 Tax=Botrytis sinoallii TaxID=1463999 RepID=UPI0019028CFB|nr:uncharacterized protein EAF02_007180 [Botrytis sinoallii]KAF7880334.1 hypothetical protein EAF02_007180 [Botrytis sinoallii]